MHQVGFITHSKLDLKQTGWAGIVWINLALNTGKEVSGFTKFGKLLSIWEASRYAKRNLFPAVFFLSKLDKTYRFTTFHVLKESVTLFRNFSALYSFYWVNRTDIPSMPSAPQVWDSLVWRVSLCKSVHVTISAPTDLMGVHLDQHTSDRQRKVCFALDADLSASYLLLTVITEVSYC
jgi:hypothetical protein